eukprot:4411228-Prymnesium_polylepis.2
MAHRVPFGDVQRNGEQFTICSERRDVDCAMCGRARGTRTRGGKWDVRGGRHARGARARNWRAVEPDARRGALTAVWSRLLEVCGE